ncbi:hypothetical protein K504DRAFT_450404 [Pleomassaria siparia CBS 279.74]|uniref:Uncharacterized protein n=1 Tax=Pleomassaria siparia CBS 279.74 TaxID=1314801 RepID=A0A6G1KLP6_9PLEO|nr:hypothetical protein K504DRAFT_450404 [Pleomassaria siparia CBS 279.74]
MPRMSNNPFFSRSRASSAHQHHRLSQKISSRTLALISKPTTASSASPEQPVQVPTSLSTSTVPATEKRIKRHPSLLLGLKSAWGGGIRDNIVTETGTEQREQERNRTNQPQKEPNAPGSPNQLEEKRRWGCVWENIEASLVPDRAKSSLCLDTTSQHSLALDMDQLSSPFGTKLSPLPHDADASLCPAPLKVLKKAHTFPLAPNRVVKVKTSRSTLLTSGPGTETHTLTLEVSMNKPLPPIPSPASTLSSQAGASESLEPWPEGKPRQQFNLSHSHNCTLRPRPASIREMISEVQLRRSE